MRSLRYLGAAALLVSAAVHLYLWFNGVRNQSVGPMFLINVVAGVVIAVLLVRWASWVPAFLTLGFGACTLGAFIIAATVGLLGVHTTWQGWDVFTAAAAEVVCIVVGAVLLLGELGILRQSGHGAQAAPRAQTRGRHAA